PRFPCRRALTACAGSASSTPEKPVSSPISPAARGLIDRLRRIDPVKSVLDCAAVERAMRRRLAALKLSDRPIAWVADAAAGYARMTAAVWQSAREAAVATAGATVTAAARTAIESAAWSAATAAAQDSGWTTNKRAAIPTSAFATTWNLARSAAGVAVRTLAWDTAWAAPWDGAGHLAWDPARTAAWDLTRDIAREAARLVVRTAAADAAENAVWQVAEAGAAWEGRSVLSWVDAFEAGLGLYWVTPREIVCVPSPMFATRDNRLHNEVGPAIAWPSGECYWFWKGIKVPRWLIEQPQSITFEKIKRQPNAELRRCMIERFGYERYLTAARAKKIHADETGTLWRCRAKRGRPAFIDPLCVVEVVNGSPEPDGTRRRYFLSVPPRCRTATEAVAWTYGLTADRYAKLVSRT
ncbi:MAG: DUF6745 domain-containing protein, partial [Hyphomicrobiaceae bacterium]